MGLQGSLDVVGETSEVVSIYRQADVYSCCLLNLVTKDVLTVGPGTMNIRRHIVQYSC